MAGTRQRFDRSSGTDTLAHGWACFQPSVLNVHNLRVGLGSVLGTLRLYSRAGPMVLPLLGFDPGALLEEHGAVTTHPTGVSSL